MKIGVIVAMDKEFSIISQSWLSEHIEQRYLMERN